MENALPMYDEVGMLQEDSFNFKLINRTNNPTNYILKLEDTSIDKVKKPCSELEEIIASSPITCRKVRYSEEANSSFKELCDTFFLGSDEQSCVKLFAGGFANVLIEKPDSFYTYDYIMDLFLLEAGEVLSGEVIETYPDDYYYDYLNSEFLGTDIVKYYLKKDGKGEPASLSTLNLENKIDSGTINPNQSIEYELRLWIDSSVEDEEEIRDKFLNYKINVEVDQNDFETVTIGGKTFDVEQSYLGGPYFSSGSQITNGRGIYKYTEDGKDVYYFRGAVTNNHVIFGGYCWEMVRTTKTGGVKMIYDGEPVDGRCNNTGGDSAIGRSYFNERYPHDNAYVGYMYGLKDLKEELANPQCIKLSSSKDSAEVGTESNKEECDLAGGKWVTTAYEATHANIVDSTIKKKIDSWFSASNLNTSENLEKIEDAVYCNDRSISKGLGYGKNATTYSTRDRLYENKNPSLECANVNDRFTVNKNGGNGELTYPVGMLTADEMVLAGERMGGADTISDSYLIRKKIRTYTLSPYYVDRDGWINMMSLHGYYSIESDRGLEDSIRPVISLKSNVLFKDGGTGTENNPFVVE